MDMHNVIVERVPDGWREQVVGNVRRALDEARRVGLLVVYVAVARSPQFMSPRNRFSGATGMVTNPAELEQRMRIVEAVAPGDDEPVVRKPRISAFYGSELTTILAARDVDTLLLTGVATNFVVESTARYAADADYRVIVLEDCCGAFVREEHDGAIRSLSHLVEVATLGDLLATRR
jgi:nicotinamidase-related amidase